MPATFPAQTVGKAFDANPSISYTSPAGTDTLLVVKFGAFSGDGPTSVTWNGSESLTLLVNADSGNQVAQIWYLINPTSGARNVTSVGSGDGTWDVTTYHGVDQTNPFGSPANTNSASGGSGNSSVTITTDTDNITTEVVSYKEETGTANPTNGSSVEDTDSDTDFGEVEPRGMMSHTDSNGAITVGWGQSDDTRWVIAVADILATVGAASDASGALVMPLITIGGAALTTYSADGQIALPAIVVDGIASGIITHDADGQIVLPIIDVSSAAEIIYTIDGQIIFSQLALDGFTDVAYEAVGQPVLPQLLIGGLALSIYDVDGVVILSNVVVNGLADVEYEAIGAFILAGIQINGNAQGGFDAFGATNFPMVNFNGISLTTYNALGDTLLPNLLIGGDVQGVGAVSILFSEPYTSEFTTTFTIQ